MQKEQLLRELGFKSSLIKIYLYLLENKKATVLNVARGTGIARTNVYNNLPALKKLNLIGESIEGGKKLLFPEEPKNLINAILAKEKIAQEAVALLDQDYKKNKYEAQVKFYYGPQGIKNMLSELLTCQEKKMRAMGGYSAGVNSISRRAAVNFFKKRTAAKISVQALHNRQDLEDIRLDKSHSAVANIKYLRDVKILPPNISVNLQIIAFDNNVVFYAPPEEGYVFIFESPAFANSIKSLFDFLWEMSEPL
jgi:sugar-specific transcriptional regulator TrmB